MSGIRDKVLTVLGLDMNTVICELQPWSKLSVVSGFRDKVLIVLGLVMNIVICELQPWSKLSVVSGFRDKVLSSYCYGIGYEYCYL